MEVRLIKFLCIFVLFVVVHGRNVNSKPGVLEDTYGDLVDGETDVQNDDFENDYGDEEDIPSENTDDVKNDISAEFRTKPQLFIVNIGEVVRLPCEVTSTEPVLVWKKNETEPLYQGDFPMGKFDNIEKTNTTLDVTIKSANDYGLYSCQMMISTNNSPLIVHTVVPPTPPKIISVLPENNKTVYRVGETLKLSCLAIGYPKPKISWYMNGKKLDLEGENITISKLKLKNAGLFRCFADNGDKHPAHHFVEIHVEHKPVVSIEKYLVNSDKESDAELKCTVHGYPTPTVVWQKDGMNLVADQKKIIFKRGNTNVENILLIKNLSDSDFGEYTCSAKNRFDKVEKNVSLVKTPVLHHVYHNTPGLVLTWKAESKSPISEHQLQYRKKGELEWKELKPEVTYDGKEVYTLTYSMKGLEPGTYETRARSQNTHGWSDYSEIVPFEGKKQPVVSTTQVTPAQHQVIETTVGASSDSGCSLVTSSLYLTSITLLAAYFRQ